MKRLIYPAIIATIISGSAFTLATRSKWLIKENTYSVKFTSTKMEGAFKGLKGDILFDETNLSASKITASIESATVNTGNGMRNKHAAQGLGAEEYPTIRFESSSISKKGNDFEATGKLTIKDVTKDIKLPFTFTKTSDGGVFNGKFTVVPAEYHVDRSGTPESLSIELNVPVVK